MILTYVHPDLSMKSLGFIKKRSVAKRQTVGFRFNGNLGYEPENPLVKTPRIGPGFLTRVVLASPFSSLFYSYFFIGRKLEKKNVAFYIKGELFPRNHTS